MDTFSESVKALGDAASGAFGPPMLFLAVVSLHVRYSALRRLVMRHSKALRGLLLWQKESAANGRAEARDKEVRPVRP